MERIDETENLPEVFENDIAVYLREFCEENGIDDMTKESQSRWNAALMYIRRHVFPKGSNVLKSKENVSIDNNNISSNFNAYNYKLLSDICDYYIYLCYEYDKECSINGYSFLTGINTENIYNWGSKDTKLTTSSYEIYQKLRQNREESLSSKLATANKNPVGILAILNRHYQWNLPGVSKENAKTSTRTAEQIEQMYGNGAKKELPPPPE